MTPLTYKDFYKTDHRRQYPEGTSVVYSDYTPRSDEYFKGLKDFDHKIVWFGLQMFIKDYLIKEWNEGFFNQPKAEVVAKYKRRLDTSLGKDSVPVEHIEALHDLGYLPLRIKALPEGSQVPMKVPVLTITNTLPEFYWLVNDQETVMSSELWKPTTVATIAFQYRKLFEKYDTETGPTGCTLIQGHDFSARGLSGRHDMARSGTGHLLSFIGTDTIPAIDAMEEYYNADAEKEVIGVSVPASEHSVICMGSQEGELETIRRLITDVYPSGIVSVVSDSWDFFKVITEYATQLKDEILNRQPILDPEGNVILPAKCVWRPDSGSPEKILCGYVWDGCVHENSGEVFERYDWEGSIPEVTNISGHFYKLHQNLDGRVFFGNPLSEAEVKGAVECLWDIFGGTTTDTGYKLLDSHVGLIYGDSITLERAEKILRRLKEKGFASGNVVFGIGSYTYQMNTRDTFGFAMKATYGEVNGEAIELFKDPKTDSGVKKSARGLLRVELEDGEYKLYDQQTWEQEAQGELRTVFEDGKLIIDESLSTIRSRVETALGAK